MHVVCNITYMQRYVPDTEMYVHTHEIQEWQTQSFLTGQYVCWPVKYKLTGIAAQLLHIPPDVSQVDRLYHTLVRYCDYDTSLLASSASRHSMISCKKYAKINVIIQIFIPFSVIQI